MTQLAISAVAAVGGYMVGGPTGAMLGWTVASSLTADNPNNLSQATIADLRLQTAQYGVDIPTIFGRERVAGNIIWATNKTPYQSKTVNGGGKGGNSTTTTGATGYKASFAIALCKGPIIGISRVWQDGALIVDTRTTVSPLIGTLYTGSTSQNPDATMQSHLGAGNVPAYRGIAYIVCTDFDLGQAGRIPTFSFEILRSGVL